jgi:hypothetical protein
LEKVTPGRSLNENDVASGFSFHDSASPGRILPVVGSCTRRVFTMLLPMRMLAIRPVWEGSTQTGSESSAMLSVPPDCGAPGVPELPESPQPAASSAISAASTLRVRRRGRPVLIVLPLRRQRAFNLIVI